MRQKKFGMLALPLSALLAVAAAGVSFGHGGSYRGPGDVVPPNVGPPGGDTTPPGPPAGTPTTSGRGTGPGSSGTGTPGAVRPQTGPGLKKRQASGSYDQWEFWWEHNREPYLALKQRIVRGGPTSGSAGYLLGVSGHNAGINTNRPTAADVREVVAPMLRAMLKENEAEIVDSAVLALGRVTRADDAEDYLAEILQVLQHPERTAREAAALALGVLGSDLALEALQALVIDNQAGRVLCNRPNGVEERVRAFAAASLGLLGRSAAKDTLMGVFRDPNNAAQRELQQMTILALGQLTEEHDSIVAFLLDRMRDRSVDRIVRAQTAIAIGKLHQNALEHGRAGSPAARAAIDQLVAMFQDDKTDLDLLRSLAQALGMLATVEDEQVLAVLKTASQQAVDNQTRHFSMMALARIGARDTQPALHAAQHHELEEFLLQELCRPTKQSHRPWAALAIGVYTHEKHIEQNGAVQRLAPKLIEELGDENNPSYQGAMGVALGLSNYRPAEETLRSHFEDSHNQPLKGYLALALGLLGANMGDRFRAELTTTGLDPKYRLQLARALGVMNDREAVDHLLKALELSDTMSETTAIVQAIGLIGDRGALEPLIAQIENPAKTPLQRGFACVALGMMADKDDLPWNTVFSVDSNYRAKTESLAEILDIL